MKLGTALRMCSKATKQTKKLRGLERLLLKFSIFVEKNQTALQYKLTQRQRKKDETFLNIGKKKLRSAL